MANVKITDLPVYASVTAPMSDVLPIVDVTTNITKKVSVSTLLSGAGGSGTVTNVSVSGLLANAFLVSNPSTTPALSIQNASSASTQFLRADGTWAVPAGSGVGLSSVGLSLPNSFTVANSPLTANGTINVTWGSGLVPVANLGTGTPSATTYLNGLGQWTVPSGGGGGGSSANISSALNIYNSSTAGTGLMGVDLTVNAATVTLTAPSTIGLNGIWTLSAALPNGFTSGDLVIFNTSDRSVVGIGTYTVTAAPAYTITGVIYDPTTSSPAPSTLYTNVVVKRGVSISSGSTGVVGTWVAGTAVPDSTIGSVGQYYSQTNAFGYNYLSYVKTNNTTWTPQPILDTYTQSQGLQGLRASGVQIVNPTVGTLPTLGVRITASATGTTSPSIRAVNTTFPDTNDYPLTISGQNAGGIALGTSAGTCPLLAGDYATGFLILTAGSSPTTTPQTLFSSGAGRTPHWSDATAYAQTFINGNGYSWTYQFTIGTSAPGNNVVFTSLPYITDIPTLAVAPATITAPSGGFTDFTTFANAFVAYINAESLALPVTASIDSVNHLITVTTSIPNALLSPNPPTSASLLPVLGSATGQYVTSVTINGTPTGAVLASKQWTFSPTYLTALENQLSTDLGFNNYAYLILAATQYVTVTTTFTWSAPQGRNTMTINGNFTKLGRGYEITFDSTGAGPIYVIKDVGISVNQGIYTTNLVIWNTFSASYSNSANTIYQVRGRTQSISIPGGSSSSEITVPWTMFSSNLTDLRYTGSYTDGSSIGTYTFRNESSTTRRYSMNWWLNFNSSGGGNPNVQCYLLNYNPVIDSSQAYVAAFQNRGSFAFDNYNLIFNNSWTTVLSPGGTFKLQLVTDYNGTVGANAVTSPTPFKSPNFPVTPGVSSNYGGLMVVAEV